MRVLGRILMLLLSLPLLVAGGYGLAASYAPDSAFAEGLESALAAVVGLAGSVDLEIRLRGWLEGPLLRFSLAPTGLVLLIASIFPSRGGGRAAPRVEEDKRARKKQSSGAAETDRSSEKPTSAEKRYLKKAEKQARMVARKGDVLEAAELLFGAGHLDGAADYFVQAGQFVRAAEIRHDQNRFVESAELYVDAGRHESAGSIFSQQGEYGRAAECFVAVGSLSVAAEMYEKAGDLRRAADCYKEAEFLRHAAASYVKCKAWIKAAECLEQVYTDENLRSKSDGAKQAELTKLIKQAGKLFQRAEEPERALAILEKGECYVEAAELATALKQFARAAELFQDAGEVERAAEALRELGEDAEAARLLANLHRDRGESKEAALYFEEAGLHLEAGDLWRSLEEYERAGDCFQQQNEFGQAAEMYALAEQREKAAECFERAGKFAEAAECLAPLGRPDKEAALLEQAGDFLRAGETYRREGMDEEAITVLQKVDPEQPGFSAASALLGDIFQSRGQLSLAIKKLLQALGERELDRDTLPIHYRLASVYSANGEHPEAAEAFEKILAFDYHYEDVEQCLLRAKEQVELMPRVDTGTTDGGSSRPAAPSAQPGRYQIVGELGRGGMGIVYRAKDSSLDRVVAFKVLPDTLKENPQALKNFLREAQAAAKLNHPNIVTVYDTGEQDGRYYIAMEYVDGTTLKEILRRRGAIAPAGILHVLVQICEALAYAHDKKVVHRDVKTANVMWTRDKKAKLMDFGLARVIEEVRNHTTVVSGTPYYMSPEQTLGRNIDHRTDIYSLGVTLFELAAGAVPFKEGNIPYHHVHTPPPDVLELQPKLPSALAAVINRCLRKDPAQRYQSTREILAEIKSSLAQPG